MLVFRYHFPEYFLGCFINCSIENFPRYWINCYQPGLLLLTNFHSIFIEDHSFALLRLLIIGALKIISRSLLTRKNSSFFEKASSGIRSAETPLPTDNLVIANLVRPSNLCS